MAQVVGYTCDYCKKFSTGDTVGDREGPPVGWLQVRPRTTTPDNGKTNGMLDICGNECLARLAIARIEADGGTFTNRRTTTTGRRAQRARMTDDEVRQVLDLHAAGSSPTEIAELIERPKSTVYGIIKRNDEAMAKAG